MSGLIAIFDSSAGFPRHQPKQGRLIWKLKRL